MNHGSAELYYYLIRIIITNIAINITIVLQMTFVMVFLWSTESTVGGMVS